MGRPPQLFACFDIVVDSFFEGRTQFVDTFTVKADDITNAGDVADKHAIFVAIFNPGRIALVSHHVHGRIPLEARNHVHRAPGRTSPLCADAVDDSATKNAHAATNSRRLTWLRPSQKSRRRECPPAPGLRSQPGCHPSSCLRSRVRESSRLDSAIPGSRVSMADVGVNRNTVSQCWHLCSLSHCMWIADNTWP